MYVQFVQRPTVLARLLCDAEIVFDEPGPLESMKLVGFSLWRSDDGDISVTFPSRAYGAGTERHFYDYLRPANGDATLVRDIKSWIVAEYYRWTGSQPPAAPAAVPAQEVWS